jgi:aspartyl-tRNA synthetase
MPGHGERIWTTELAGHAGEMVSIKGWLHRFRQLGAVSFLIVRDGKGLAQVVVDDPAQVERLLRDLRGNGQLVVAQQTLEQLRQERSQTLATVQTVPA